MELYLTFSEYTTLSGKVQDEETYNKVARKAQRLLDYITFNRIPIVINKTGEVPEEVKDVLAEFVDRTVSTDSSAEMDFDRNVASYSNGVETITYKLAPEAEQDAELKNLAYKWLPDYLVARGVSFDVEKYLQTTNNNP